MFHKEGYKIIIISFIIVVLINLISKELINNSIINYSIGILTIFGLVLILQFFRNPKRSTLLNDSLIISPVDGKVVVIKKVYEKIYSSRNYGSVQRIRPSR